MRATGGEWRITRKSRRMRMRRKKIRRTSASRSRKLSRN
jgi:hypothetical protein